MTFATRWILLGAYALAGALAVPLHATATPLSAAVAVALGLLGLWLWGWSGLVPASGPARTGWRALGPLAWLGLGLLAGLILLAAIRLAIEPGVPAIGTRIAAAGAQPILRRAAVVYVAAVGEELMFRLILFSLVAGLAARLTRTGAGAPAPLALGNGVAALAFAAVHLPAWSGIAPGNRAVVASVLGLNFAAGILLGYVFAKRGIVAATWTHAGADCAIQFIGPLTG